MMELKISEGILTSDKADMLIYERSIAISMGTFFVVQRRPVRLSPVTITVWMLKV